MPRSSVCLTLLMLALLDAAGSRIVRGEGDGLLPGRLEDLPDEVAEAVASLGGPSRAAAEGEERLPSTPDVFTSPDHLRNYLNKLNAYYAIAGRPRFGKRSDGRSSSVPSLRQRQPWHQHHQRQNRLHHRQLDQLLLDQQQQQLDLQEQRWLDKQRLPREYYDY